LLYAVEMLKLGALVLIVAVGWLGVDGVPAVAAEGPDDHDHDHDDRSSRGASRRRSWRSGDGAPGAVEARTYPDASESAYVPPRAPSIGKMIGIGFMVGERPTSLRSVTASKYYLQESYTVDDVSVKSLWISGGVENKNNHLLFMIDGIVGGGAISGTTRYVFDGPPLINTPVPCTGTLVNVSMVLRVGARGSLGDLSFAAGVGLGGMVSFFDLHTDAVNVPQGAHAVPAWFMPVWADATYKVNRDWGLRVLASSDRAEVIGPGATTIGVALIKQ
jgi:hypothetical protein